MNILVIDPVISSEYLVNAFKRQQTSLIAAKYYPRSSEYDKYRSYAGLPFAEIIDICDKPLNECIEILLKAKQKYNFTHGFCGAEGTFSISEQILRKLFPEHSNDPKTSHYRFDKYWMNEVLRLNNLPYIPQISLSRDKSLEEKLTIANQFYDTHGKSIVIKPRSGSAASVDVFKPNNKKEIEKYFSQEHMGWFYATDFLIQQAVDGKEYYVDIASIDGNHIVTAVGFLNKEVVNGAFEYLYVDNLALEDDLSIKLSEFGKQCLVALGMRNGLSHIEMKNTSNGIRLIELNPRISGTNGYHNEMAKRRYNVDQVDAYLQLLRHQENQQIQPKQKLYQRLFYFKNKKGAFSAVNTAPIKQLQSYITHQTLISNTQSNNNNKNKEPTLFDVVMYILLESNDYAKISADTQTLIALEYTNGCLVD